MVEYYCLIHVHGQKNSLSVLVIQVTWLLPLGYSFKQKDNNYVTPEKGGWQGLCLAQFLINIIDIAVSNRLSCSALHLGKMALNGRIQHQSYCQLLAATLNRFFNTKNTKTHFFNCFFVFCFTKNISVMVIKEGEVLSTVGYNVLLFFFLSFFFTFFFCSGDQREFIWLKHITRKGENV